MTAKKKPDPTKGKAKPKKGAKADSGAKDDASQKGISADGIQLGRPKIEVTDEMIEAGREYLLNGFEVADEVTPTLAGLACWFGISKFTLQELARRDAVFSSLCDDIRTKQESMLLAGGLRGDHNPTICKLMLSKHGYSDTVQHQGDPDNPIQTRGELAHAAMTKGQLEAFLAQYGITSLQD